MTYTYKLARRLAISRNLAMLSALVLFAACMGETTGPEAPSSSMPLTPIAFRVVPSAVTIETHQPIRFRGESHSRRGERYASPLSWEASGGSIDALGKFSAKAPGTYKVVGRGPGRIKPDTSIVIVVPPLMNLIGVEVSPETATVSAGATHAFVAVGRLSNGRTAPIGVVWSATGGTIDPSGLYTAGDVAGSYRIVATNTTRKLADTAGVTITAAQSPSPVPTPDPDPIPGPPIPPLAHLFLTPVNAVLETGTTQRFAAYGRDGAGDSVSVTASFNATGGSITPGGLFTAGPAAGTYRVVATASGLSDTALVTLHRSLGSGGGGSGGGGGGIPFGSFSMWDGNTLKPGTQDFTLSISGYTATNIIPRIAAARTKRVKLILALTGGSHHNYLTGGVFDRVKWLAKLNTFDTPAIKAAIASGVADGTIIGNSVMDEPNVSGMGDGGTWGPKGTMTKARVDSLCGFVKDMFPTMPAGVSHNHDTFEPDKKYYVCDFLMDQYAHRKGDVAAFRDAGLALARRDGMAIMFSMNILSGGIQSRRDGSWNCPLTTTGGRGTFDPNCRMTAEQVREWGIVLGSAGCGLLMWRYDEQFMMNPENQQAFKDVAARLATLPAKSCHKP